MCARFTVLSDTPIAAAIAGCVIPLSRNSTIWMRWRWAAGIFHRSAVLSRRTSALLHLTICCPRIRPDGRANHTSAEKNKLAELAAVLTRQKALDSTRHGVGIRHHIAIPPCALRGVDLVADLRSARLPTRRDSGAHQDC